MYIYVKFRVLINYLQIMQFLLQILQRPLRISALGFFYFGYNLIYKVCYFSINIIIILINLIIGKYIKNKIFVTHNINLDNQISIICY